MRRSAFRAGISAEPRETTDSKHAHPVAANLLDRQFTAAVPNKAWLAAMRDTMPQELTLAALRMAISNRRPGPGLLHHSDRGSQYAARAYRRVLDNNGMLCSMSRNGDCWDNAPMESFFGSMKTELGDDTVFETRNEAKVAIEVFNIRRRLHFAIGYRSPAEMEQTAAAA
jgi:putative transposase